MTSISIIGAGRAAGFHAAATAFAPGVQLVGVAGRRPGDASELAELAETSELTLDEAVTRSDAVIVAVPPGDTAAVLGRIGRRVDALLVETPSARSSADLVPFDDLPATMIGANLIHSPAARRALAEVAGMNDPHHFTLRSRGPRPDWGDHGTSKFGGGTILDPGSRFLPVLLAAIAAPVLSVSARMDIDSSRVDTAAVLTLTTDRDHQTDISIDIAWSDDSPSVSLQVASDDAVMQVELFSPPSLEINGESVDLPGGGNPLVDLGYSAQISRLAAVARGDAAAWPGYELAPGLIDIATAAAFSATHQGLEISPGAGYPQRSVCSILGAT